MAQQPARKSQPGLLIMTTIHVCFHTNGETKAPFTQRSCNISINKIRHYAGFASYTEPNKAGVMPPPCVLSQSLQSVGPFYTEGKPE